MATDFDLGSVIVNLLDCLEVGRNFAHKDAR